MPASQSISEDVEAFIDFLRPLNIPANASLNLSDERSVAELLQRWAHWNGLRPLRAFLDHKIITEDQLRTLMQNNRLVEPLLSDDIEPAALQMIGVATAKRLRVVPAKLTESALHVFTSTGDDMSLATENEIVGIAARHEREVVWRQATQRQFGAALSSLASVLDRDDEDFAEAVDDSRDQAQANWLALVEPAVNPNDPREIRSRSQEISTNLNDLFSHAVSKSASDIHISAVLRDDRPIVVTEVRIDGELTEFQALTLTVGTAMVGRIRTVAGMGGSDVEPSDASLDLLTSTGDRYTLRLAYMPLHGLGPFLVIRILYQDQEVVKTLNDVYPPTESNIAALITGLLEDQADGMFLLVGRTGDGKSTTMAALLDHIITPEIRVCTIENPVEFRVPGARQVQVNSKLGFAAAVRAFLRMDPEVIVVGEVRDLETASACVQASQTGHRVISTLHARYAGSTSGRLVDLDLKPWQVADTVTGVLAQRLLRTICSACAGDNAAQCSTCKGTGMHGRTAVGEFLPVTHDVAELMRRNAAWTEISEHCKVRMEDHAHALVQAGRTTMSEAERIVGNERMRSAVARAEDANAQQKVGAT